MTDALNRAIRNTFIGTAGGRLRLESTGLTEESHGTRLHFTGFHRDGTPFVVLSAPFTGSPIERAAQMAVDNLNTVLDSAEGVIRDVDNAAADVQSALGLNTNGGPGPL